jgi:transcriptional regulator with XRE-family HTH domain
MRSRSPTVRQRRLAAELRRLREAAGLQMERVAAALGWSVSKVSRIETGQIGVRPRDVGALLALYGVDGGRRDYLVRLAQEARQKSWWHQEYRDLPSMALVGFESEAASLRVYDTLIPGLLQTADYAQAVLRAVRVEFTAEDVRRRVKLRMARQAVLRKDHAPALWVVLDEVAVRRQIGGWSVMKEQLDHLCQIATLPNVTLQVLPFASGEHAGLDGGFAILGFSQPSDPDVVYVENLASDLYLEDPEDVERYCLAFDHLRATALRPSDSMAFLVNAAQDLRTT